MEVVSTPKVTQVVLEEFFQLYPSDAAKFLYDFSEVEILEILESKSLPTARKIYLELNAEIAGRLVQKMDHQFFSQLFSEINPGYGVTLLSRLDTNNLEDRLKLLNPHLASEYRELMEYPLESAGRLMDPRVMTFRSKNAVELILKQIREVCDRRIADICIVNEDGVLIAVVPLQEIAVAQPEMEVGELMKGPPVNIHALAPREDVVTLLEECKLTSLPVVDLEGKVLGIIQYDALVNAAQEEVSVDLQAMFGAGREERALSKFTFAVKKRLPWLFVNLGTVFLAAAVVGIFEDTIAKITALAIFLPVVAGQSGNTGSQALAVTMRGLALREIRTRHWFQMVRKESAAGFVNGVAVALATSFIAFVWMGSTGIAIVIGVAMVFSMVIAGLSGAAFPIILKSVGQDPAQSSSIILTTVTDVVGFLSFLGLATALAGVLEM